MTLKPLQVAWRTHLYVVGLSSSKADRGDEEDQGGGESFEHLCSSQKLTVWEVEKVWIKGKGWSSFVRCGEEFDEV